MTEEIDVNFTPEKPDLKIGFIPLTDCCVLAVASERGLFEKHGLHVELSKEASWANIRDKVCVGALDGAHMLAGIPIATTLGLGFSRKPMITGFSMNLNGNAITVSNDLYQRLVDIEPGISRDPNLTAPTLKKVIDENKASGKDPLTFAMVYPFSNHNYEIRYWMAAGGIDPDNDVHLRVIPPQYMVGNLEAGQIDGFCVGGPWNSCAMEGQVGRILVTGYEIWNNSPEKVLGVTAEWNEKYPQTHLALISALMESAAWIDDNNNREQVAKILSDEKYVGIPEHIIHKSMNGAFSNETENSPARSSFPDFNIFNRYLANFPWCSHAAWIITQMYRWGQIEDAVNIKAIAEAVYRPDIYRLAASAYGIEYPPAIYKTEGEHDADWALIYKNHRFDMGSDSMIDGMNFNVDRLLEYINGFDIHSMRLTTGELQALNS